jgi:HEPN domain-containing protein
MIATLLRRARGDLKMAKATLLCNVDDVESLDSAAYIVTQSLEKVLKYALELKGDPHGKSHDFSGLINHAKRAGVIIPEWLDNRLTVKELNSYATETRYLKSFLADFNTLRDYIDKIDKMIQEYAEVVMDDEGVFDNPHLNALNAPYNITAFAAYLQVELKLTQGDSIQLAKYAEEFLPSSSRNNTILAGFITSLEKLKPLGEYWLSFCKKQNKQ